MSEWERLTKQSGSISWSYYQKGLARDYLASEYSDESRANIAQMSEEQQSDYWQEFRVRYSSAWEDPKIMLEEIEREIGEDTPLSELAARDKREPAEPTNETELLEPEHREEPLPEPTISEPRRGRHTEEESIGDTVIHLIDKAVDTVIDTTIVRPISIIGRWLGFGRRK